MNIKQNVQRRIKLLTVGDDNYRIDYAPPDGPVLELELPFGTYKNFTQLKRRADRAWRKHGLVLELNGRGNLVARPAEAPLTEGQKLKEFSRQAEAAARTLFERDE